MRPARPTPHGCVLTIALFVVCGPKARAEKAEQAAAAAAEKAAKPSSPKAAPKKEQEHPSVAAVEKAKKAAADATQLVNNIRENNKKATAIR